MGSRPERDKRNGDCAEFTQRYGLSDLSAFPNGVVFFVQKQNPKRSGAGLCQTLHGKLHDIRETDRTCQGTAKKAKNGFVVTSIMNKIRKG